MLRSPEIDKSSESPCHHQCHSLKGWTWLKVVQVTWHNESTSLRTASDGAWSIWAIHYLIVRAQGKSEDCVWMAGFMGCSSLSRTTWLLGLEGPSIQNIPQDQLWWETSVKNIYMANISKIFLASRAGKHPLFTCKTFWTIAHERKLALLKDNGYC